MLKFKIYTDTSTKHHIIFSKSTDPFKYWIYYWFRSDWFKSIALSSKKANRLILLMKRSLNRWKNAVKAIFQSSWMWKSREWKRGVNRSELFNFCLILISSSYTWSKIISLAFFTWHPFFELWILFGHLLFLILYVSKWNAEHWKETISVLKSFRHWKAWLSNKFHPNLQRTVNAIFNSFANQAVIIRNSLHFHYLHSRVQKIRKNPDRIQKPDKFPERIIISYLRSNPSILWRNLKIWWKSGKIREKIRKPDKFPEWKIIISYLRSKASILWRNKVKTA